MHRISRIVIIRSLVVTTVSLLASAPAWSGGVTCDGDISDIRAFSEPGAPPPVELIDPYGGFTDSPILPSQILGQLCSPNCVSPSGFNVGSVVLAYDPGNDAYYIGLDVSPLPGDDVAFANGSGAWDSDGDGDPNILTDGLTMTPPILYDVPIPLSGLTDRYVVWVDVGGDGQDDLLLILQDSGGGPVLSVQQSTGPPGCLAATAGWTVGDYAGNGPDVEFVVGNVSCLGLDSCDYYAVGLQVFAETDADISEEHVPLVFNLEVPNRGPVCCFACTSPIPTDGEVVNLDSSASYDPDGQIVSWAWAFGDGHVSTEQNPTHVYSSGACFQVALTVTDDAGLSDTACQCVPVRSSTEIPLCKAGWHMIAQPHSGDQALADVVVRDDTGAYDPLGFCDAVAAGWVQNPLSYYDPVSAGYGHCGCEGLPPPTSEHTLRMGYGYWLFTFRDRLTLVFPVA